MPRPREASSGPPVRLQLRRRAPLRPGAGGPPTRKARLVLRLPHPVATPKQGEAVKEVTPYHALDDGVPRPACRPPR